MESICGQLRAETNNSGKGRQAWWSLEVPALRPRGLWRHQLSDHVVSGGSSSQAWWSLQNPALRPGGLQRMQLSGQVVSAELGTIVCSWCHYTAPSVPGPCRIIPQSQQWTCGDKNLYCHQHQTNEQPKNSATPGPRNQATYDDMVLVFSTNPSRQYGRN